jgi:hypothetical protein
MFVNLGTIANNLDGSGIKPWDAISIETIKISSETIVTVDESKFYIKTKNSIRNSTIDICAYDFK